jgi:hypothetical protein
LYAGDHWSVVRSIADWVGDDIEIRVWVCSAGFGLVQWDDMITPYSATFAPSQLDSVASRDVDGGGSQWWTGLADWKPRLLKQADGSPSEKPVRTLRQLASQVSDDDFMLMALSASYERALRDDLLALKASVREDGVALFSTGARTVGHHDYHLLSSASLKSQVGGAMQSLNARLVRRALQEQKAWFPSKSALADTVDGWLAGATEWSPILRTPMTDAEVTTFIRQRRQQTQEVRHTVLLRELREGGRACEQSRFARLFREVVNHRGVPHEPSSSDAAS